MTTWSVQCTPNSDILYCKWLLTCLKLLLPYGPAQITWLEDCLYTLQNLNDESQRQNIDW